jgi:hypothetical protein
MKTFFYQNKLVRLSLVKLLVGLDNYFNNSLIHIFSVIVPHYNNTYNDFSNKITQLCFLSSYSGFKCFIYRYK